MTSTHESGQGTGEPVEQPISRARALLGNKNPASVRRTPAELARANSKAFGTLTTADDGTIQSSPVMRQQLAIDPAD
jgi:hypothetical protein